MKGPSAQGIQNHASHCLGLKAYLEHPGDGRPQPQIAARDVVWALLITRAWCAVTGTTSS